MSQLRNTSCDFDLHRLNTIKGDLLEIERTELRRMLFLIYLIREFELELLKLKDEGQVHGPVHSSIGQEAGAVAVMHHLDREDLIASTHRGHHHFLAKAYNAYAGTDYDPLSAVPEAIFEVTRKTLAEIMGLAEGYCRGRGGSMHLGDRFSGCLGTNAIVAGGVPAATGAGWAQKIRGTGHVAVSFLGDGAVNQGSVHEAMNMAAVWHVPVIYYIENNLYAVATHVKNACSVSDLAVRGIAYGIPGLIVDGMDPVAIYHAMGTALRYIRKDKHGPYIIEAKTYRFRHQAQSLPGSAYGYRTPAEEEEWQNRDAARIFSGRLIEAGMLNRADDDKLKATAAAIVADAVAAVTENDEGQKTRRVRLDLFPPASELEFGIRSDLREFADTPFADQTDYTVVRDRKLIEVIPEVLGRCLDRNPSAFLIGEEVGNMKGGAFMATKGIFRRHPDRVINTPISESGFSGMALGLALSGLNPIVEIMYPDFVLVAADQIFNQIGKFRYMYGNQYDLPLVFRTRVGLGTGYGAQHSMEPASLFALFPGWRILAPVTPFDYIGLFNSAFRCLDPVLIIEHHALYALEGPVPEDRDFYLPLGSARVVRSGSDITLVGYSYMVSKASRAADALEEMGISVEVIDLREIDYANIDYQTIGESLSKTGRILFLEEGYYCGGIGAQLAFETQNRFFDLLDHEIGRVAVRPVPIPVSRIPEQRLIPQVEDIVQKVEEMLSI
jgi:2-oxoisovalerate dehydrogenase E1 component